MNSSQTINELATALSKAQGEFKAIVKDTKGYGYKYATLDQLIEMASPIMSKHGLSFVQPAYSLDVNATVVETIILHDSGQWLSSGAIHAQASNPGKLSPMQTIGSAITYARRYQLASMLGIAAEEDTDDAIKPDKHSRAQRRSESINKPEPGEFGPGKDFELDEVFQ